ncbi:PopZ family protein [Rhizobium herbae]|uniref:Cell pole-organizing protein PopZ n=1 Tax=Rhizobium herbae TaxID=508661 RepID=A0ABS4EFI6_9HYPH|nr:PopZ family protein [Rhizobium herbae]MBP1856706.1 cell pole-organizing protein PopZ [Rhizobium herbae]
MAQPNVAREPSMDEILASIRKIIESNEPGIPGFPANDLGPAPDDAYRADRGYDDGSAEDIHLTIDDEVLAPEFEAEQRHQAPSVELPSRQPQDASVRSSVSTTSTPPLSLADVAARVRAASERHSAPPREPETPSTAFRARSDNPMVTSRMAPSSAALLSQPDVRHEQSPATAEAVSVARSIVAAEEKAEPTATIAVEHPAEQHQPLAVVAEKDVAAIVSPAVGEQVARSFGDLALAVDSSARRSFDEIAEDMLRPMLQEWLDDNLPTLVERLVREEIERVARGPRR